MISTWDILRKELAVYGIDVINHKTCTCTQSGKTVQIPLKHKIRLAEKQINHNLVIFQDLWLNLIKIIERSCSFSHPSLAVDIKTINLFVNSVKGLFDFANLLLSSYEPYLKKLKIETTKARIRLLLDHDYHEFGKDFLFAISSYRINIDWMHRLISQLFYIRKLIQLALSGNDEISSLIVKTARGVQGPWSNLDLPMKERCFEWSDIEEEVRGREKDKIRQGRYRMGLENYNGDGRAGEGFYWREIRNEPFSWYSRFVDSPYPGRNILTRY